MQDRVSACRVLHLAACWYVPKGVCTFMNCEARKKKRQRRKSAPGKHSWCLQSFGAAWLSRACVLWPFAYVSAAVYASSSPEHITLKSDKDYSWFMTQIAHDLFFIIGRAGKPVCETHSGRSPRFCRKLSALTRCFLLLCRQLPVAPEENVFRHFNISVFGPWWQALPGAQQHLPPHPQGQSACQRQLNCEEQTMSPPPILTIFKWL